MSAWENTTFTVLAGGSARLASVTSEDQENRTSRGVRLWLTITAASGTSPTLDCKLQAIDGTGTAHDIPGAAFAQATDTTNQELVVYPGVAETANVSVSDVIPRAWQIVCTQAGTADSFTYSITGCYIQ